MTVALVMLGIPFAAPAPAQAAQHGMTFVKGCITPTTVGDKIECNYGAFNDFDPDTLTMTSVVDVVHAAGGDDTSGNILPNLQLEFTGGASCNVGQTLCTLPPNSSIQTSSPFPYHTATGADADQGTVFDDANFTWQDTCSGGEDNCPVGDQVNSSGSSTLVQKLPSQTSTEIVDENGETVTAVEAGTTVHDTVTVDGGEGNPTPTGTVTVDWFTNDECTGNPADTSDPTNLNNGTADVTSFPQTPPAGNFGFEAHYSGDSNFAPSDGDCEPLAVVDAFITVTPPEATNIAGDAHTVTVTVMQNTGDGNGFVAASGAEIDYTVTDSDGASATVDHTNSSCDGTTDGNGQCTVVFTSPTTGTDTVNASVTLSLAGIAVTRSTSGDAGPGGSGPALKHFVDARITIGPAATNEVGDPHTFVVTVSADTGDGSGMHPFPGAPVTFSLENTNGANTTVDNDASTCDDQSTDANGQCTIVFTSSSTGITVGNASTTITLGDLTVTRDTAGNSGPGGSGPAAKRWVNASISIGPNGNNPVGAPHTFTVTVLKDNGAGLNNGRGVPAEGEHVDFTLSDSGGSKAVVDTANSTCDNAGANTDANGQCTIVFTSATAGTTVGNASVTLTVAGKSLTRTTAGKTGPEGSGPATKTWFAPPVELPRTGSNSLSLANLALLLVVAGLAFAGAGWLLRPAGAHARRRRES